MLSSRSEHATAEPTRQQSFVTTHWSVVLAARAPDAPQAAAALAELCRTYWYPLYAFVRRKGHSPHDAQDLTQAFFARLLEKNYVGTASPQRGRFRAFLLTAFKHFLSKQWDKAKAKKRGGARPPLPSEVVGHPVVGGGPHQPSIRPYAEEAGVADLCTFTGRVSSVRSPSLRKVPSVDHEVGSCHER
jgi:hypothetical protein